MTTRSISCIVWHAHVGCGKTHDSAKNHLLTINQIYGTMSASDEKPDAISDEERQRDLELKGTPIDAEESAASKFRQEVVSKKANLDDYEPRAI